MSYRLHIDIPISGSEEDVIQIANEIIRFCFDNRLSENHLRDLRINGVNYRLGHDEDRQKSNHLVKNENGHVNNKKSHIIYLTSSQSEV